MKKTNAALFELIHSLVMAEKKYFKMFSSLQSGDKSYLKLYDVIEKQRSYNEDAIRSVCRGERFLRQLPVAKTRLYNNILRSLEVYHRNAEINLRRQISKAGILLRKGLTAHALQLLHAAKPVAYHYEQWELLMEILVMEKMPYAETNLLKMSPLNEEMGAVLKKLNNIHEYRTIHHKIVHLFQKVESLRTKKEQLFIAKLMQHPLVRDSKQASCAEAKTYYYEIRYFYYFFKRDFIKGYKTSKEQCAFIEKHLHQLRDSEKRYMFAMGFLVIFMGYLLPADPSKYDEMQEVLKKIRTYPIATHTLKVTFWLSSYVNELNALMQAGDFEKVFSALKDIEENKEMLNHATAVTRITLCYGIAYLLFGAGSYNEALIWLRKIIDQPASELRKDTQASVRILYLLIHYELHKDEQMLDSLERSTLHFLSTRQRLFKVEKALMHCLRQIMGKPISRKERILVFHEFKITLLKLRKNPLEKIAMEEFDFTSWVESKIQNKTFAEVVREKVNKKKLAD